MALAFVDEAADMIEGVMVEAATSVFRNSFLCIINVNLGVIIVSSAILKDVQLTAKRCLKR